MDQDSRGGSGSGSHAHSDDKAVKIKWPQTYLTQETWFVKEIERSRPETQSRGQDHGDSTTSGRGTSGLVANEQEMTDASPFQLEQSKQEEASSAPGVTDPDGSDGYVDAERL